MIVRPSRPLQLLLALVLGLLCAFAVACGSGESRGLLTGGRAEQLKDDLDKIDEYTSGERCDALRDRLRSLRAQVDRLPRDTDSSLRERLEQGVTNLEEQAPEECRGADTTTQPDTTEEPPPATTEEPEPVPTTPPAQTAEPDPVPTTPAEPEPEPEPTPTTPVEPDPVTPPQDGGDAGGEEAPFGGGAAP